MQLRQTDCQFAMLRAGDVELALRLICLTFLEHIGTQSAVIAADRTANSVAAGEGGGRKGS